MMGTQAVANGVYIDQPNLAGDCAYDDIRVVEDNGQHYIEVAFQNMDSVADYESQQRKRCRMDYNVQLPYGYKLDVFQFMVQGEYQLSDFGRASVKITHRSGSSTSSPMFASFDARRGDDPFGSIDNLSAALWGSDLPYVRQQCGASIPLHTTITTMASKPQSDQSGITSIALDEGTSSTYTRLCRIRLRRCN